MNQRNYITLALVALAAALSSTVFTGCETNTHADIDRPEPIVTYENIITAAEIAAGIAIGDDVELALQYVADAREYLATGEAATVDEVVDHLLNRALHKNLESGRAIAVKRFVDRFRDKFAIELMHVALDPDAVVTVKQLIDAVERVALEIDRYGAPVQRSYLP